MSNMDYVGTNKRDINSLFQEIMRQDLKEVYVDTETNDLSGTAESFRGLCISTNFEDSFWFPKGSDALQPLAGQILRNPDITKVFHNAKFDYNILEAIGLEPDKTNFEDTSILAYTMNQPVKLYTLAKQQQADSVPEDLQEFEFKKDTVYDDEFLARKCGVDTRTTGILWHKLKFFRTESYSIDKNIVHLLRRMEKVGVKIDQGNLGVFYDQLTEEVDYLRQLGMVTYGCDLSSNQQVGIALAKLGYRLPYTDSKKQFKTGEEILRELRPHPLIGLVLLFREKAKLLSTYILPLIDKERIYTVYNHTRVVTGRLSSSDPFNMQNIPDYFRSVFIADDDEELTSMDASQIELRTVAYMSQDKIMTDAYANHEDIHDATRKALGLPYSKENRKLGKTVNFAILYGAGWFTLVETAKKNEIELTKAQAEDAIARIFDKYRGLRDWINDTTAFIERHLYVKTLHGRIRNADTMYWDNPNSKAKSMRELINMPIQGTASEIIKKMMAKAQNFDMRIQVHDEMVFNGFAPSAVNIESGVAPFETPLEVKVGKDWGNMTVLRKV